MNIYDLINRAQRLRKETQLDSVSPDRVGGLQEDTLKYINEFQLLASSPSLHKIYASVSAMQSDKSPKSDLTGKPLKPGQLVVIVPANQADATAGDVYRYDGPSGNTSAWTFVAKIGAVPADAELSATSTNPPQNKVVTEKLTELESEIDGLTNIVNDIKPIVINGNVTNASDEEDITSENNLLKFRDRPAFNSMGYVILRKNKTFAEQVILSNTIYEIRYDFELNQNVELPDNCILKFNGGKLSNGVLVGANTQIQASFNTIFHNIIFQGSWFCPNIYASWIGDITKVDGIRELFKLCHDNIFNVVHIDNREYLVSLTTTNEVAINVPSNTHIELCGTIKAITNQTHYYIFQIWNKHNVKITGGGVIDGGRENHAADTGGEWGHGVFIRSTEQESCCKNIFISDITITQCWGDGVNADGEDIVLRNLNISHCRRQGISFAHANNIIIENCRISNIDGTAPQCAIDIEPLDSNYNKTANNVYIRNNIINNDRGILLAYADSMDNIVIRDNSIHCGWVGLRIADETGASANNYVRRCVIANNIIQTDVTENGRAIWIQNRVESLLIDGNQIHGVVVNDQTGTTDNVVMVNNILEDSIAINNFAYKTRLLGNVKGNIIKKGQYVVANGALLSDNTIYVEESLTMPSYAATYINNVFVISANVTRNNIFQCHEGVNFCNNTIINNNASIQYIIGRNYSGATGTTYVLNNYIFGEQKIRPHYTGVDGSYKCVWRCAPYVHNGWGSVAPSITPNSVDLGQFKMQNGKPVFWNGSAWVDATGASV